LESAAFSEPEQVRAGPKRLTELGAVALLSITIAGAAISSQADDWHPLWLFLTLLVLGVLGDRVHASTGRMRLSGGLTIVGIAMALLGPAPAVAICFVSRILDALLTDGIRLRGRRLALAWNLGMYVNVLAGGLLIRSAISAGLTPGSAALALVVVAAISAANLINFVLAAIWISLHGGPRIDHQLRHDFIPTLPWIAAPNFLAGALATLYFRSGPSSLLLSLGLVAGFYVLLSELLNSQRRRDELEVRTAQLEDRTFELASMQVGVLVTIVRTLSLRDESTARHSAAVARYAHALALAAGCSDEELRTIHTAGLLHDIGKFAFPDHILSAASPLSDDDFRLVRDHPVNGAELVRTVDGMEEIASIILAHHERIGGGGYPFGLQGEEIPVLARMISIADVYDVMTARDTYRTPVSSAEAITELRRVSGTQLDGDYVELFVTVLEREQLGFAHTEESDFEAELEIEQHVRRLARPRAHV
jgi:putative nucleotidyltransferase with HDIG domain